MHINKLEVKGFGKLASRTIYFSNGINIIYGNNETGKTTLQWFIKGMLYGLKNNRGPRNGLMPPHKRFEPWEGGQFGGSLAYTLDNGSSYRVERSFISGVVQLFDSCYSNITGSYDIGKDKMPMFAEKQFGIDDVTFERTVLIRQMEIRLDDDSLGALAGRLANVSSSGSEDISFSRAEKALTEALKNNVGTSRSTKMPLDKLEARLKQLEEECSRLQSQQEQRRSILEELLEIQSQCSRMEAGKRFLEHVGRLINIRKALDINLKREAGLREAVKNLKELEETLKGTEAVEGQPIVQTGNEGRAQAAVAVVGSGGRPARRKQKRRMVPVICLITAMVFIALLGNTVVTKGILSSWRLLLIYAAGVLSVGITGVLALRKDILYQNGSMLSAMTGIGDVTAGMGAATTGFVDGTAARIRAAEIRALVKNICSNVSLLCERQLNEPCDVKQALVDVAAKLEELSTKLEQGIEAAKDIECSEAGYFNGKDLDTLLYDSGVVELEEAWNCNMNNVKEELLNASLKAKYYEGRLVDSQEDSDELQHVEEETVAVKEKITYLKYKGNALKLAHEVLLEAGLEIKRTFAPGFDSRMSTIITGLTAGRYTDLRGDDRLSLKVAVPGSGDIKSALMLSGAATDQMYLALRLAMADLLSAEGESLPLIMDEVFSQFDDNRTALALRYLHNAYENGQVLIFTCKQREVELAREICGSSMNLVEL